MDATIMLANRLREMRESSGLSQSQLADALGVSRGSISYYENGERTPDVEFLVRVREYFQVDYQYLLGESKFEDDDSRTKFEQSIEHLPASRRDRVMEFHKRLIECAEEYEKYFSVDRVDFFEKMIGDVCTIIDAYKAIPMDLFHYNTLIVVKRFLDKMTLTHYAEVIHRISQGFDGRRDVDNDGKHS